MNGKPNLYMTIGLSGSGKSTIAKRAKTVKKEFPDKDKRLAVCYSQWRK
jgi:shikimate kinase